MILAAGFGTRLQPHTLTLPKPMVSLTGQPLLGHILDHAAAAGITQATINTHYLAKIVHKYTATRTDLDILISHENEILDTGGGIKKALHHFGNEPFYAINGDAFWVDRPGHPPILDALADHWNPETMDILLALQPVETMKLTEGIGDYDIDSEGRATRRPDKTGTHMFTSLRINHPRIFENAPDGAFSYRDLMDEAQDKGRLHAIVNQGDWHHISTAQDLNAVEGALSNHTQGAESTGNG